MRYPSRQPNPAPATYVSRFPSPHARAAGGKYFVEKLLDGVWKLMSYGDIDHDARVGKELDRLIQRAEVLEGVVRIRRRDDVIVWTSPVAAPAELESA